MLKIINQYEKDGLQITEYSKDGINISHKIKENKVKETTDPSEHQSTIEEEILMETKYQTILIEMNSMF